MRLPIVQVGGVNAGFDGGDFVALLAQTQDQGGGVGVMLPGDGFLRAQRGLGDSRCGADGR